MKTVPDVGPSMQAKGKKQIITHCVLLIAPVYLKWKAISSSLLPIITYSRFFRLLVFVNQLDIIMGIFHRSRSSFQELQLISMANCNVMLMVHKLQTTRTDIERQVPQLEMYFQPKNAKLHGIPNNSNDNVCGLHSNTAKKKIGFLLETDYFIGSHSADTAPPTKSPQTNKIVVLFTSQHEREQLSK